MLSLRLRDPPEMLPMLLPWPWPLEEDEGERCMGQAMVSDELAPLPWLAAKLTVESLLKMSESRRPIPKSTGASLRLNRLEGESLTLRMMLCT